MCTAYQTNPVLNAIDQLLINAGFGNLADLEFDEIFHEKKNIKSRQLEGQRRRLWPRAASAEARTLSHRCASTP